MFEDQAAFVGDFKANPIINCLELDGIIGSNLMRHCNWMIDQKNLTITASNQIRNSIKENSITLPFKSNQQYSMFTDLNFGKSTLNNVLIDYGSNGSVSLTDKIFKTLSDHEVFTSIYTEKGYANSGIVGKPIAIARKRTSTDSIRLDSQPIEKVLIKTGKTTSIGNGLLSRFHTTIDWETKELYLKLEEESQENIKSAGIKLGYSLNKGVYIQSVLEDSDAFRQGIKPLMKVVQLEELDFENGGTYCEYIGIDLGNEFTLVLEDENHQRKEYTLQKKELIP